MAAHSPVRSTGLRRAPAGRVLVVLAQAVLVLVLGGVFPVAAAAAGPKPVGTWPLHPDPAVVRGFDPPSDPFGPGHRGVDLAGSVGQPVRAALAGSVVFAGWLAGRGVVVVDHGDTRTTYEPVVAGVRVGDLVSAGDRIGSLEFAGSHCLAAACLHWGWLRGEVYLNPLDLVGHQPVRLLPLQEIPGPPARIVVGPRRTAWVPWLTLLHLR